jgi:hypothetical protein
VGRRIDLGATVRSRRYSTIDQTGIIKPAAIITEIDDVPEAAG